MGAWHSVAADELNDALHSADTERALLGAIIVDNAHLSTAEEWLRAEHMGDTRHRRIFAAMSRMGEDGAGINIVSLRERLTSEGALSEAGGVEYLASLIDGVPNVETVEHWAEVVLDKARRRYAKTLGQELALAAASNAETELFLDRHANALQRLLEAGETGRVAVPIREALKRAEGKLERLTTNDGVTGVPCGLIDLDRLIGGFQPGSLVVVASRPGCGKSVFCAQTAITAAAKGFRGLVFSMEMPPEDMAARMWMAEASVEKWDLKNKSDAWLKMQKAYGRIADLPITFDSRESPTMAQIRAAAKRESVRHKLGFVVVDYLQRVEMDPVMLKAGGPPAAIGEIARGLKSLARMLDVPVIAACQLNRAAEGKEPTLADLAESGKIEREADIVTFLHPDSETQAADHDFPTTHMIVGKHRAGACRRFVLSFEKRYSRLVCQAPVEWRAAEQ